MPRRPLLRLAVAGALLGSPAARPQHDPPQETIDPTERTVEVRIIEVPVPTHDWAAETVEMGAAAVFGALLAVRFAARPRRRPPPASGLIDITDTVRAGHSGAPDAAATGSPRSDAGTGRRRPTAAVASPASATIARYQAGAMVSPERATSHTDT